MTPMIRKQIYIRKQQHTLLKDLAKARGTSESGIIRAAIDHYAAADTSYRLPIDDTAWKQVRAFIKKRRQRGVQGESYQWQREDAYEE